MSWEGSIFECLIEQLGNGLFVLTLTQNVENEVGDAQNFNKTLFDHEPTWSGDSKWQFTYTHPTTSVETTFTIPEEAGLVEWGFVPDGLVLTASWFNGDAPESANDYDEPMWLGVYEYDGDDEEGDSTPDPFLTIDYWPLATGNVCFLGSEKVQTDQGKIRFDNLTTKNTINGKKIKQVIKVINSDDNLIFIHKHALGHNVPNQNTYISRNHGIFLMDAFAIKHNLIKIVRARTLINKKTITEIKRKGDIIYNVLLEKYSSMIVNNMVCETLNPNDPKAKKYIK